MKRQPLKNILALMIGTSLLIPSMACTKGGRPDDNGKAAAREAVRSAPASGQIIQESDPFYDLEEFELDIPGEKDRVLYDRWINDVRFFSDCILVSFSDTYGIDAETQEKWKQHVLGKKKLDKEEAERIEKIIYDKYVDTLAVYNLDGTLKDTIRCGSQLELQSIFEGKNGEKMLLYNQDDVAKISELSDSMELINTITLPETLEYVDSCLVLENGNFFVDKGFQTYVYGADGKLVAEKRSEGSQGVYRIDGKYYQLVTYFSDFGTSYRLMDYDIDNCKQLTGKHDIPLVNMIADDVVIHGNDKAYVNTGNGLCLVDPVNEDLQVVLPWSQTDCYHGEIFTSSLRHVSDEEYYFALSIHNEEDQVKEAEATQEIYRVVVQHLKKAQKNPHAGKRILSAMGIQSDNEVLYDCIVDYNRDMTKKNRVVLTEYSESWLMNFALKRGADPNQIENQIYMDLLNATGPDILINFGMYSKFEREKVLLDLNPLINGKQGLDRSSIFDNLLTASEKDGKLFRIPLLYSISGFVSDSKYVGDKTEISWADMDAIRALVPENETLFSPTWRVILLQALLSNELDRFVNYDTQEVNFDNEDFRKILEFVKENGIEPDLSQDNVISIEDIAPVQNMCAMDMTTISECTGYAYLNNLFKDPVLCGFPTSGEGGMSMVPRFTVSISKNSQYTEEAWDFVKTLLDEKAQAKMPGDVYGGLPINRAALDLVIEKTIKWEEFSRSVGAVGASNFDQDSVEGFIRFIESVHTGERTDVDVEAIVEEEAKAYFADQKSLDDVIKIIEKRVKQVVQELA